MITSGKIVETLDKEIKGQVVSVDYNRDTATVYNWLSTDENFDYVETYITNLVETPLWDTNWITKTMLHLQESL